MPINFSGGFAGFGSFRLSNAKQFNQYVGGKFYDKVFFAPKDTVVFDHVSPCFDDPGAWSALAPNTNGLLYSNSSYSMSPAAMFSPDVMKHIDDEDPTANGYTDPWSLAGGMRSPSFSQCLYPSLKSHMLEHHWLQGRTVDCNPGFEPGSYDGCEPYYFNHAENSVPVTLFYDGHVGAISMKDAVRADSRMRAQTQSEEWGLWSKDTPMGDNGFFDAYRYDLGIPSSFHILTTDGIRGRDITAD